MPTSIGISITCALTSRNLSTGTTINSDCILRWATVLRRNLNGTRSLQIP
jgi:hypothetical protein